MRVKKENIKKIKKYWDKFWFVVWKDDSFKGWIISVVFLFVVVKFLFLPLLSFATGTTLPLAIVESCSMYHETNFLFFHNFGNWWKGHENKYSAHTINNLDFRDFLFTNGFNKGDILFIVGVKPEKLKIGDVLIYKAISKDVIHRIINIEQEDGKYIFSTMGDNVGVVQFFEESISENQLVGRAVFKIVPSIGWAKLIAVDVLNKITHRGNFEYVKSGFCEES